eukprot:scaffold2.g7522.t1
MHLSTTLVAAGTLARPIVASNVAKRACRCDRAAALMRRAGTALTRPAAAGTARAVRRVATVAAAQSIYDFTSIDGQAVNFDRFKGKYKDLVALQQKYGSKGLEILEPGTSSEIKAFAQRQGAQFPIFAKSDVNGPGASPLWTYLKGKKGGLLGMDDIKWNFTKASSGIGAAGFLVDKKGEVVGRFPPTTTPLQIESEIEKCL